MTESVATLKARAALAGFVLAQTPEGTFSAERWGHVRYFRDAGEVERWLDMVTGKKRVA
jgi:hypothetical protein